MRLKTCRILDDGLRLEPGKEVPKDRKVLDREYEYGEDRDGRPSLVVWTTRKSVVALVSKNLGVPEPGDDDGITKLINDFNARPYEERIRYGIWSNSTPEGKAQRLMKQGKSVSKSLEEAGLA